MISIICAMDEKRGIGKDGGIPWHIPADFKRFKEITMGHPIIMGRRTFESIGRVLPGRAHIVITRNLKNKTEVEGLIWTDSLELAIDKAKEIEKKVIPLRKGYAGESEIFIIGGGELFKEALEKGIVDKLYLTIIEGDFKADTFFPDYSEFKIIKEEKHKSGKYRFKFIDLEK